MRRETGRPKKLRNKTNDRPRNPHVLPRKLATVTCHGCGAMEHNKWSCKENRVVDRAILKDGNKNKKSKHNPAENNNNKSKKNSEIENESSSQVPTPTQPTQEQINEEFMMMFYIL